MELRQYIAIALKWWWLMILAAAFTATISYLVSQRLAPVYRATTTLLVGRSIQTTQLNSENLAASQQLAQTYADIAQRQPVLQSVIDTLQLAETWRELQERVWVEPVVNTQLLQITVEASSAEEAQATADEIAYQLIRLSPTGLENQEQDENRRFVRERLENLQTKIMAGQERIKELEKAMAASLSAQQVQELQSEINALESLIADWENNYTQLLIFVESKESPNYLAVVEPAQADPEPVRPRILFNTLIAGVAGLLLTMAFIFLLEYLDDTLKSAGDLSMALDMVILGAIGHIKGRHYPDKLIAYRNPFAAMTEVYRMLRSSIQFISTDQQLKSIMVTSSIPGEGKSITVANLGVVMAQAGRRTIIVDADLRQPVLHQIFQLANERGLTDLLRSPGLELDDYLSDTQVENLQVLTSGRRPPNPSELLASERMDQLITRLNGLADVIIYDSPPALVVTDANVLASQVDGVVLVIEVGQTRTGVLRQTISNLQQARANLLGGVLNRVSYKRGNYYAHYYARNGRIPAKG